MSVDLERTRVSDIELREYYKFVANSEEEWALYNPDRYDNVLYVEIIVNNEDIVRFNYWSNDGQDLQLVPLTCEPLKKWVLM